MNSYHLIYHDAVQIRNFTYKTTKCRSVDEGEEWKQSHEDSEKGPRGLTQVTYFAWLRDPGARGVLLLDLPHGSDTRSLFGRLLDLVRHVTNGLRPWRVFVMVANDHGNGGLMYEIHFIVIGEEYRFESAKLVKLRELTGIVGDEHFKKGGAKP